MCSCFLGYIAVLPDLDCYSLKSKFHWSHSNWIIGIALSVAACMIGVGLALDEFDLAFILAEWILFGTMLWALGCWLTSDTLHKLKPTAKQKKKHNATDTKYRVYKFGVSVLIAIGFVGSLWFVSTIRLKHDLSRRSGFFLVPASDPTPPNGCPENEGALIVFLGPMTATATKFPNYVLGTQRAGLPDDARSEAVTIDGRAYVPRMILNKNDSGNVGITVDIYDSQQNIVVSIVNNKIINISNDAFDVIHPDLSTLTITIKRKKERVLDVRFLNDHAIRILGHFRYPNASDMVATEDDFNMGGNHFRGSENCVGNGKWDFLF
jgi:hypothetical protein